MPSPTVRATLTAGLVVLFALLSWKAGKEALSDAYLRSAVREAARPAANGAPSPKEKWLQARQSLDYSLRYAPRNPATLEQAGLHDLRGMRIHPDARPYTAYARGAYADFRMALAQRPASAQSWANLALT